MDGCTKSPQLEEGENLNTKALGTGRTALGGTSAPARQAQGGPSPAFVKENIDVLRTMIKELDNRGQKKVKEQRSEAQSRSKSKSVKSKPQSVRASRRNSSSNSGYDTVSDSGSEDLSMPYRRTKPMPFTSRIIRFRYHRWAKLPPKVRVYEWSKDPKDHLSIFSAATDLDPKSVDGFEELSSKFLKEFTQQKRISAFIHGHGHPELAKKLNDKIPKTVDEMWAKVRAFIRVETAADTTEAIRSPRRLHTFDEDSKGNPRYRQCELPSTASDGGDSEEAKHEQVLGLRKVDSSSERYQARRLKEQGLNQRKKEGYQHGEIPRIPKEAL
ncbi:hypothetical protein Tco_1232076 [Tanacetum coccineum]